MGRHCKPEPEEVTIEVIQEALESLPDVTVSPVMPTSEVPDIELELEGFTDDELGAIAAPVNRMMVYARSHGDLELAKLTYGWIESSADEDQKALRFAVLSELSNLHVAIDAIMEAADWVEAGMSSEQRRRRLAVLTEYYAHNPHAISAELAQAIAWIEGQ